MGGSAAGCPTANTTTASWFDGIGIAVVRCSTFQSAFCRWLSLAIVPSRSTSPHHCATRGLGHSGGGMLKVAYLYVCFANRPNGTAIGVHDTRPLWPAFKLLPLPTLLSGLLPLPALLPGLLPLPTLSNYRIGRRSTELQ